MNNSRQCEHNSQEESKRKSNKPGMANDIRVLFSISTKYATIVKTWKHRKQLMASRIIEISSWGHGHEYTREYICKFYGYSIKTVSRLIGVLESMGLIEAHRLYKRPNKYRIGPMVHNAYIRQSLVQYLPALRLVLSLAFLLSKPNVPLSNNSIHQEKSAQFKTVKKQFSGEYNDFTRRYREQLQPQIEYLSDNVCPTLKKGVLMPSESILFRPFLGSLSSLELTPHGKAELEAYPEKAVLAGDLRLAKALKAGAAVASPLGYLISGAKAWCKENNVQPDVARTSYLIRELSIDTEAVKFSAIKVGKEEPKAQLAARASTTAWKSQLERDRAGYDAEQAELPNLTREQRKARIEPALETYKKCSPEMRRLLVSLHPFKDAQELIDELLNPSATPSESHFEPERVWTQEERDTWAPLIPTLSQYTQEQRAENLTKHGMPEYLPLVEELIVQQAAIQLDESVWEEV